MRSKSLDAKWWLNLNIFVGVGLGTSISNIDCLCRPLFNQKPLISLMASCMITTAMMNGYGAPGGHTDIPTFTGMMILHVSFHCLPGMHETCFNHGTFFIPNLFLLSLLQHKKRGISWATFMKVVSQSFLIPKAPLITIFPTLWWNMLP